MPHKVKQLFTLVVFGLVLSCSSLSAQIVRKYPLPIGRSYEYTLHSAPAPGYSFIGPYTFGGFVPSTFMILDTDGALVYLDSMPIFDGTITDVRLFDNGFMSYYKFNNRIDRGKYFIMDSTFAVVDSVECGNGYRTDGHELLMLDNGNYLILCLEDTIMDVSSLTTFDGFQGATNADVQATIIQELDAAKNIVFQWRGLDHYTLPYMDTYFFLDIDFLDFGHPNALAIDLDGNILVSHRFFNDIAKIDRQTGSVIWQLGGYGNDFTFVNDTQPFNAQHSCNILPNGNITIFDNGERSNPTLARGVEYALNQTSFTATKVWEAANIPGITSFAMGSMQRLSNGNNLIAWGVTFDDFFSNDVAELDAAGNTVWELNFPDSLFYYPYRAYKGLPEWDMEALRPTISCDTVDNAVILSAPDGYDSYWWNTGDTTANIVADNPGEYYVLVENRNGKGQFGSKLKVINNLTNPCTDTIISTGALIDKLQFEIYPNPASTYLNVRSLNNAALVLYNTIGARVMDYTVHGPFEQIDISMLPNGSYIGVLTDPQNLTEQHFKLVISH